MKNQKLETRLESIPAPIAAALRELLRRTRKITLIRGFCAVASVFIALTLLVMGADLYFTIVSASTRWILSCAIYVGMIIAIYKFLVSPLARSYTLAGVALMIESHHPEMQERLSSAVELLTTSDDPDVRGSQKLIDALAEAAADDARKIRPKKEVSIRAAVPYLSTALSAVLMLAVIFAASPRKTSFLLARAMAPFANLPNISAMDLEIRPGDAFVARGKLLEIALASSKAKIQSAKIRRIADDGIGTIDQMKKTVLEEKENMSDFIFTIDSVERNFTYRIEADDAVTRYYKVTAVNPPVIEKNSLRIDYPEYACTPPRIESDSEGTIAALAGSVATVSVEINKACQSALLKIQSKDTAVIHPEKAAGADGDKHLSFRIPLTPGLAGTYSICLADEYCLKNPKFERSVQALPDMPPIAVITDIAQKEIHLKSGDHFPLYFLATDDIGLASVELLLEKDSTRLAPVPIQIPSESSSGKRCVKKFEGNTVIDLADPRLDGAKRIVFQISAADNLPKDLKGPQLGLSEKYTIVVDENANFFEGQALQSQKETLKNQLDQAKKELEQARRNLASVKEVTSKNEKKPEQMSERVGALRDILDKNDSTLRDLSETLKDGFFNRASSEIEKIRQEEIAKAQGLADQINLAETPEERGILVEKIGTHIDKSLSALDELLKKNDMASKTLELALQMRNLAEMQENLARRKMEIDRQMPPAGNNVAASNPEMKKQLDEWRRDQGKIADSVAKYARENAQSGSMRESDFLDEGKRMAGEARRLADEQTRLSENLGKISKLQEMDRRLGELSVQQASAAEFAKSNELTAPASDTMKNAADRISNNKLDEAARHQSNASATLGKAAARLENEGAGDPWKRPDSPTDALKEISAKAKKSGEMATASAEKAKGAEKAAQAELEKYELATKDAGKKPDKTVAALAAEKMTLLKDIVQKSKEASAKSEQNAREAQNLGKEASAAESRFNPGASPAEKGALLDQAEQKARDAEQKAILAVHDAKMADSAAKMASNLAKGNGKSGNYHSEPVRNALSQSEKAAEAAKSVNDAAAKSAKSLEEASKNIVAMENFRKDAEKNLQKELAARIGEKIASARREEAMAKHALDGARNAANSAKQAADQATEGAKSASKDQNGRNAAGRALESIRKSLESGQQSKLAESLLSELASDERSARQEIVGELAKEQNLLNDKTIELMNEKEAVTDARKRDQTTELEKRQAALAEEAKDIAALVAKESPPSGKSAEQAKDSALKTKDSLRNSDLPSAAGNATEATKSLDELADGLEAEAASRLAGNDAKEKPGSPVSSLAMRARKVTDEQEMIRNEISALADGSPLDQLAAWQNNIERRAVELKKEAESLKTSARELGMPQKTQQLVTEGEQNLQNGTQNSDNAGKSIAKMTEEAVKAKQTPVKSFNEKLPAEAMQAQATSSKSFEQAAAKMDELAGEKDIPRQSDNSAIFNEAGRISDVARKLADEESSLAEDLGKIPQLQNIRKHMVELAKQQASAAEFAKSNNLTAPASEAMKNAAELISDNKFDEAARHQNDASATLGEAVDRMEKEGEKDSWKRSDSLRNDLKEMSAKANKSGELAASAAEKAKAAEKAVQAALEKFELASRDAAKNPDKTVAAVAAEKMALLKDLALKTKEASAKSEQNAGDVQKLAKETSDAKSRFNPGASPDEKGVLLEQAELKTRDAEQKAILADSAAKLAESAAKIASDLAKDGGNSGDYHSEPVRNAVSQSGKAAETAKAANDAIAKAEKSLGETSKDIVAMENFRKDAEKNLQDELASEIGGKITSARRGEAMAKHDLEEARKAAAAAKQAGDQAAEAAKSASNNQNRQNAAGRAIESMRKSAEADQQSKIADSLLSQFASDERSARQEIVGELAKAQKSLNDKTMRLMNEVSTLAGNKPLDQLGAWQDNIKKRAEELRKDAELLKKGTKELNLTQENQQLAAEGEQSLQSAHQNSDNAGKSIAKMAVDDAQVRQNPEKTFSEKLPIETTQALASSSKSLGQAAAKMAELAGEKPPPQPRKDSAVLNEAGRIAEEAHRLADEQARLAENLGKISQPQDLEERLGELSDQQALAAEFAKSNDLTAPVGETMKNAAEQISDNKLDEAARHQNGASAKLGELAARLEKEGGKNPWKQSDSPRDALKEMSAKAKKSGELAASAAEEGKAAEKAALGEISKFERVSKDAGKKADKAAAALATEKTALLKGFAQKALEASAKSEEEAHDAQNLAKDVSALESSFNPAASPAEKGAQLEEAAKKTRDAEENAILADHAAKMAESAAKMASDLAKIGGKSGDYHSEPARNAMSQSEKAAETAKAVNDAVAKAEKSLGETSKNIGAMEKFQKDAEKNSRDRLAAEIGDKVASARRDEAMAKLALEEAGKAADAAKQAADQARQYSDAASKNTNRPNAVMQSAEGIRKSLEAAQQSKIADSLLSQFETEELSARQEIVGELAEAQRSLNDKTMKLMKEKKAAADANMRGQTAEIERRQDALSEEARNIAAIVAKESPPSGKSAEQARDSVKKAKDSLRKSDLPLAAANATEAARNLGELAKGLEAEAASRLAGKDDNEKRNSPISGLAMRAKKAEEEEEMIRKEIAALVGNRPLDHLAAWQDNLGTRAESLVKEAKAFEKSAKELDMPEKSRQTAAGGENDLQNAHQNSDNASKSIAKMAEEAAQAKQDKSFPGKIPGETLQALANSSKSLEQAATKMAEVQDEIDKISANSNPQIVQETSPDLTMASGLARKASLDLEQNAIDAIRSTEALKSVARNAMNEAAKAGANPTPGKMSALQADGKRVISATGEAPQGFEQIGKRLNLTYNDWLRLPASLRSEILQSSSNEGPEEYRDIIKRYFEELSKLGMEKKQ